MELLPVREFADCFVPRNGTKWLLESPENVSGLLQIIDFNISKKIDFSRLHDEKKSFILNNLRQQKSDLVFTAPFLGRRSWNRRRSIDILTHRTSIRTRYIDGISDVILHDANMGYTA